MSDEKKSVLFSCRYAQSNIAQPFIRSMCPNKLIIKFVINIYNYVSEFLFSDSSAQYNINMFMSVPIHVINQHLCRFLEPRDFLALALTSKQYIIILHSTSPIWKLHFQDRQWKWPWFAPRVRCWKDAVKRSITCFWCCSCMQNKLVHTGICSCIQKPPNLLSLLNTPL
jgi:hypothetical protein